MSLPANIRINTAAPFPAIVKGSGVIAINKVNGIWTVGLVFGALVQNQNVADPVNSYFLIWNALTGVFSLVSLNAVQTSKVTKILTGAAGLASPYAALPTDQVLIVKQAAANPFTITVDWSQRKQPLTVVAGDTVANFANITITPAAGQTQMATVNYSYVIDSSGGSVTLTPLPDGTGAY